MFGDKKLKKAVSNSNYQCPQTIGRYDLISENSRMNQICLSVHATTQKCGLCASQRHARLCTRQGNSARSHYQTSMSYACASVFSVIR